jgi:hypothetical protein
MNLAEFLDGSVAEKAYFAPVFGAVECARLDCLSLGVAGRPLPAVAFVQIASATNSANTTEVNTFGAGVGSLSIPADYFVDGSVANLSLNGTVSAAGGETLTLRLYAGFDGNTLIGSVAIVVPASTSKGLSSLYQQSRNADLVRSCSDGFTLNSATFSTVLPNIFRLTSQWSAATASLVVNNLVLEV